MTNSLWDDVAAFDADLSEGSDLAGIDEMLGIGAKKKTAKKAEPSH